MLKWFSGGKERSDNAIDLLVDLSKSLDTRTQSYLIVTKYINELKSPNRSVPYILNSFNLEISKAIRKDNLKLDKDQSQILTKIRKLSNIRYGYNI